MFTDRQFKGAMRLVRPIFQSSENESYLEWLWDQLDQKRKGISEELAIKFIIIIHKL